MALTYNAESLQRVVWDVSGRTGLAIRLTREATKRDVETVMDVATGWNVDLPFDAETLGKMFRKYPAAASAIYQEYRTRMTEGKVGNL